MGESVLRQFEAFLLKPLTGLAVAAIAVVVGWKLNARGADWLLGLAWVLLVVSVFRTPPISHQVLVQRALWTMLPASIVGLGLCWLAGWQPPIMRATTSTPSGVTSPHTEPAPPAQAQPDLRPQPPTSSPLHPAPRPEVALSAHEDYTYTFSWVPSIDMFPRFMLDGKQEPLVLTLNNLSGHVITAVDFKWRAVGRSINEVFLSSAHLQKYHPHVDGGMLALDGPSFLVSDYLQTSLPYVETDPVSVIIPAVIWNSIQFKLIDEVERIDPRSDRAHGLTRPLTKKIATLEMQYKQYDNVYAARFYIDVEIEVLPDGAIYGGIQEVPLAAFSEDNLRATMRFSCHQE